MVARFDDRRARNTFDQVGMLICFRADENQIRLAGIVQQLIERQRRARVRLDAQGLLAKSDNVGRQTTRRPQMCDMKAERAQQRHDNPNHGTHTHDEYRRNGRHLKCRGTKMRASRLLPSPSSSFNFVLLTHTHTHTREKRKQNARLVHELSDREETVYK